MSFKFVLLMLPNQDDLQNSAQPTCEIQPHVSRATKVQLGKAHCRLLHEALLGVNTVALFGLLHAD